VTLALDPSPELARRGRADAAGLARAATARRHRNRTDHLPTEGERAELQDLAARAADRLGEPTRDLLPDWLGR
jgi:hypothetical protein